LKLCKLGGLSGTGGGIDFGLIVRFEPTESLTVAGNDNLLASSDEAIVDLCDCVPFQYNGKFSTAVNAVSTIRVRSH
jgi:hypothetical protein